MGWMTRVGEVRREGHAAIDTFWSAAAAACWSARCARRDSWGGAGVGGLGRGSVMSRKHRQRGRFGGWRFDHVAE